MSLTSLTIILLNVDFDRSLVNYFVSKTEQRYLEGTKLLAPIINARRNEEMKRESEKPVGRSVYLC